MRQIKTHKNGFTLVELMLAMSFVSVLLVAIAMLTIQISNIYTRGITLKQVNEAGLEVSNDMQRAIQSSDIFVVDMQDVENNTRDTLVQFNNDQSGKSQAGRLCLGSYTYVWNYGTLLVNQEEDGTNSGLVNVFEDSSRPDIRFVKVNDSGKALCRRDVNDEYPKIPAGDATTELLVTGDRDLALHKFTINSNEEGGLYSVSFTIGTNNQQALTSDREGCKPPVETDGFSEYCSVNTFDIVARSAGWSKGQ